MVKPNRLLALVYAVLLGVGETWLNWGNWQYAPLWVVDYFVVLWLLCGAIVQDQRKSTFILMGGWSFSLAMMYMAIAIMTDPNNVNHQPIPAEVFFFISAFITMSAAGLALSYQTFSQTRGN